MYHTSCWVKPICLLCVAICICILENSRNVKSASYFYGEGDPEGVTTRSPKDDSDSGPGKTFVAKEDSYICLLIKASMKIVVPLQGSRQNITININATSTNASEVLSFCHTTTSEMIVGWRQPEQKEDWGLAFKFKLYGTDQYSFDSIVFMYNLDDVSIEAKSTDEVFSIPKGTYYNCSNMDKIDLHPNIRSYSTVRLTFALLQAEAFRNSPNPSFVGTESRCRDDDDSSLTYLIVGVSIFTMAVIMIFALCLSNDESREVSVDPYVGRF
uniref:Uncharacterized protein n=1 Tax=Trichobilharzia regenti TaxID=157069 RepID=A0AA85J7L2_TRIRE|nr:unnamed protein product [Trichobilharzia regenti]